MSFESSSSRRQLAAAGSSSAASSRSWAEWTQQLQAYVAWVNSQLRKKPGTKEVKDLRRELQDGTVLVELIEIVANEKIPGASYKPSNSLEMKENVERVLQFMKSRKIKMHQIRSSDIVEGNMKSIMRLILALAAHFKPSSVKQSSHQAVKNSRSLGIAQEAASTLASIRKDAESIKQKMHRPSGLKPEQNLDHRNTMPANNCHVKKPSANRKLPYDTMPRTDDDRISNRADHHRASNASPSSVSSSRSGGYETSSDGDSRDIAEQYSSFLDEVQDSQAILIEETRATHNMLIELQNVLLNGEENIDESLTVNENSTPYEQLVIYQSRLQQAQDMDKKLREELSRTKQECMQLQGMKQGLHQRLSEQQQEILEMKAKKLRADMTEHEDDEDELESLRDELTAKTTMLNRMHTELERRDKTIAHLENELQLKSSHTNEIINSLENQTKELQTKLDSTTSEVYKLKEEAKSRSQETKDDTKSGRIQTAKEKHTAQKLSDFMPASEIELAKQAVNVIKQSSDPTLLSHVEVLESILINRSVQQTDCNSKSSTNPRSLPSQKHNSTKLNSTKVLCFTSKSVTPYMKSVNKKLGDLTLLDFKLAFGLQSAGSTVVRRYHFKSLDPEFGTVKEELTVDTDLLPGWEGKVIGWIEDDTA